MQVRTIALATAFALTSSMAFAQMGGGNGFGAEVSESSGTAVDGNGVVMGQVYGGRLIRAPGSLTGRDLQDDRMLPNRAAPDADEDTPAGR